jgi:hypothetical protein
MRAESARGLTWAVVRATTVGVALLAAGLALRPVAAQDPPPKPLPAGSVAAPTIEDRRPERTPPDLAVRIVCTAPAAANWTCTYHVANAPDGNPAHVPAGSYLLVVSSSGLAVRTIEAADRLIWAGSGSQLGFQALKPINLNPGEVLSITVGYTLRGVPGSFFYTRADVDFYNAIAESDETNNWRLEDGFVTSPTSLSPPTLLAGE